MCWLCAAPESASFCSPVSDRHTQRQAQAEGGGGRSVPSWKRQGQGRPKKWNPIRLRISNSPIPNFLNSGPRSFLWPFTTSPPLPSPHTSRTAQPDSLHQNCLLTGRKLMGFLWRVFYTRARPSVAWADSWEGRVKKTYCLLVNAFMLDFWVLWEIFLSPV